jgi:hypothetical protein
MTVAEPRSCAFEVVGLKFAAYPLSLKRLANLPRDAGSAERIDHKIAGIS